MNQVKQKPPKNDVDVRQDGIVLISNGLKARSMAVDNIDLYLADSNRIAEKNWGCYMLQQSVELMLKGLIKYYYEDFRAGHLVAVNAKYLLNMSSKHTELREIDEVLTQLTKSIAFMMLKWQSLARYKNLRVKKSDVEVVDELSENLTQFIRRHGYLNT